MSLTGCHGRRVQDSRLYARLSHLGRGYGGRGIHELAKEGAVAVVSQCGKTSLSSTREGLIVGETGLHEDVFEMRDRISFRPIAFRLDDTLQLEEMLRAEVRAGGHSPEQASCIQGFAEHLESLTDPMVEADRLQKEIDVSAFNKSTKESQDEKQRELENLSVPNVPTESVHAK